MNYKLISFIVIQILFSNIYLAALDPCEASCEDSCELDISALECRGCPCMLYKKYAAHAKQSKIRQSSTGQSSTGQSSIVKKLAKKEISPQAMKLKLDAAPIFISVIPPEFHAKWRIPGAINIPLDMLEKELKNWAKNKEIILYCFTDKTSSYAFELLTVMGFTHLSICKGGIKHWMELGYRVDGTGTFPELVSTINEIKKRMNR